MSISSIAPVGVSASQPPAGEPTCPPPTGHPVARRCARRPTVHTDI